MQMITKQEQRITILEDKINNSNGVSIESSKIITFEK